MNIQPPLMKSQQTHQAVKFFQWAMSVQKRVFPGADPDGHDMIENMIVSAHSNDPEIAIILDDATPDAAAKFRTTWRTCLSGADGRLLPFPARTHGGGRREFSIRYCKLVHELARTNASEEKRGRATLEQLRAVGLIRWDHLPLQRNLVKTIYIPLSSEQALFGAVLESQFNALDGHPFENEWRAVLNQASDDISNGRSAEGLPNDTALHHDILRATAAVLNNRSPHSHAQFEL